MTPITAAARVAAPQRAAAQVPAAQVATQPSLARTLAAMPPVDGERVQRIKAAITEGRFPLSPSTVADALIAAKYEWMHDDEA